MKNESALRHGVPGAPVCLILDRPYELRLTHKCLRSFCAITECRMDRLDAALSDYGNITLLLRLMVNETDASVSDDDLDRLIGQAEREKRLCLMDIVSAVSFAVRDAFTADGGEGEEGGVADPLTPATPGATPAQSPGTIFPTV